MYHSGFTHDLEMVVERLGKRYDKIKVVGYSLGGNMLLKYLGTADVHPKIVSGCAVSVPLDLLSSAKRLLHWSNKAYTIQFLLTLNKKIGAKAAQFPDQLKPNQYKGIKTLWEYDDKVTAPLHGFVDALDYYEKASSKPTLHHIKIPTLCINALDDPFLAPPCFPYEIADNHDHFHFMESTHGGHVGFGGLNSRTYWSDLVIGQWLAGSTQS
jgi:uncharacterized protein